MVECPKSISWGVSRPQPKSSIFVVSIRQKDRLLDHRKSPKIPVKLTTLQKPETWTKPITSSIVSYQHFCGVRDINVPPRGAGDNAVPCKVNHNNEIFLAVTTPRQIGGLFSKRSVNLLVAFVTHLRNRLICQAGLNPAVRLVKMGAVRKFAVSSPLRAASDFFTNSCPPHVTLFMHLNA